MRELKDVKAQEKELLDKLNNKLKKMEQVCLYINYDIYDW